MGQGFSLTTLSAGSAGIDVPELSDLVYEGTLGTARFMKSIRARHHDGVVMVKVVVKPYSMNLAKYRKMITHERNALADIPNALGYQRILESDTNGYLVRQYVHSSLYDRMSTRPFLEDIEKKWLAFQLLCAIRDCHARDIFHGDIKTENTLVTSWNWLYLTDFSSSYKPTTLPEDNPADFSYFFDTAGRRTCYLAPERFLAPGELPEDNAKVTWAMDVFSVGCVIAELFLEAPFFNLSQLFKYRKGEYDPSTAQLHGIKDTGIREMVAHMIQIDPNNRYSAEMYLKFFKHKVFPEYFYSFLHQYMGLITDPSSGRFPISGSSANLGEADDRVERIWHDFDKISFFLASEEPMDSGKQDSQAVKRLDIRKTGINVLPVHLNIPNHEHYVRPRPKDGISPVDDGALIFLSLIVSSVRNTARTAARIKACDLLLAFSERLTDEAKLDRVLPYLHSLLTDKSDVVKVAALRSMTQLLALVSVISLVNANIFPDYILTRIESLIFPKSPKSPPSALVRATYAACIGSLASTAARFLHIVSMLKRDESLPTDPVDKDEEFAEEGYQGIFDNARAELVDRFEDQTISLITDSDASVRRVFLGSVPEMCIFFGTAKSSDIILSHLNTYLNDRDWLLKCAFFETVVGIAAFLGPQSVEEFILPLMVQALTDPEDFVVERVLRSLANLAELGLLQRGKTWEIVDIVGRFTMHRNIWIREAAVNCLSRSTKFLSPSDKQCIFLPLIRPYLRVNVKDFDELSLLDALKKPLPKAILDLAVTWAQKVDRGIFWKPVNKLNTSSFGGAGRTAQTISVKELGPHALSRVPTNDEDEQWLAKLRNMGMSQDHEWKLLALREYIGRVAIWKSRQAPNTDIAYLNSIIHLRDYEIKPTTIVFEDPPTDEPTKPLQSPTDDGNKGTHTITDALLDASMTIDDSIAKRRRSAINNHRARTNGQNSAALTINNSQPQHRSSLSPSPISPSSTASSPPATRSSTLANKGTSAGKPSDDDDSASELGTNKPLIRAITRRPSAMSLLNRRDTVKTIPDTSTTSTNVFGKVETPTVRETHQRSALAQQKEHEATTKADIRHRKSHTYQGNDPNILQMLDAMYVDKYPGDAEFGPAVVPMSRRRPISRSSVQAIDKPWRPEGILVTTFAEHVGAVTRIVVAPDHVFFITGGDDGTVRVWDSARLERNLAYRSRQTHKHAVGSKITSLCFIDSTHSFVSAAGDGTVNVVKVDFQNGGGVSKYNKLRVLREYQLPKDEIAIWSDHFKDDPCSILILATNKSRVLAIDLRTMKTIYTLENPVHHGTPTAFCIDRKHTWLLLGTSHGVLDLWDLRFRVRVRAWGVPGSTTIYRICLHPFKGRGRWVCVAGGSGQGEVTVWDVEKAQCREVYRAGGSRDGPKGYEPWPVDEDRPEGMLGRFATSLEPTGGGSADRGVRAMVVGSDALEDGRDRYGFLITGGSDKKIRFWDLLHVENSMVVSGLEAGEAKSTFTASHPTASLVLNTERVPRPGPTSPNAGAGGTRSSTSANNSIAKAQSGKSNRSTVISLQQQQLLRSHLDSVLDIALLEFPYGMTISADRSGVIYVFQ